MGKRTNTARWTGTRWRIDVQKDGVRKCFYASTPGRNGQREANAKADAWLDDGVHDGNTRTEVVWGEYLESVQRTSGTCNYRQKKAFGENFILPVCGHVRIGQLTEGHLQDTLDKGYKQGCLRPDYTRKAGPAVQTLSRKTLQGIRGAETSFLRWCRQHGYSTLHPENLKVPAGARLKEKQILQPDALQTLFSVDTITTRGRVHQDDFIFAYRFAAATGLRPGELLGLWVGDVKGRTVNLSRAVNQYNEETRGKNENAVRSFEMNDYAFTAYQSQMALLRAAGVQLNYDTPLFQITTERALYHRWRRFQECNGITPCISLYELRHTFVSMAQDLPDGRLKPLVGHSRSMDTRGIYGHKVDGSAGETADELTTVFKRFLG